MLYRNIVFVLSCVVALTVGQTAHAQERAAMESYACNYVEGKGLDDLMAVAAKWDKWASKNNPAPYRAYVLTPSLPPLTKYQKRFGLAFHRPPRS